MKTLPIPSIALGACLLALSAGVAFATDLHKQMPTNPGPTNPAALNAAPGQTGSNVLSSCSPTSFASIGNSGPTGDPNTTPAKMNSGTGSPFNPNATKKYAGNPGNPATNPKAVSQYDNACAQAQLH